MHRYSGSGGYSIWAAASGIGELTWLTKGEIQRMNWEAEDEGGSSLSHEEKVSLLTHEPCLRTKYCSSTLTMDHLLRATGNRASSHATEKRFTHTQHLWQHWGPGYWRSIQ